MTEYDIRLPILRGDEKTHLLLQYHDSMTSEVQACGALPRRLLLVTSKSPNSYKRALERLARFFQREGRFDHPQFESSEYSNRRRDAKTDADLRAFLWYDDDSDYRGQNAWPAIGEAVFRLKGMKRKFWILDWVWLHPYQRRHKHLTAAWPFFRSMFGIFVPGPPLSAGMHRFLRKLGYDKVLEKSFQRLGKARRKTVDL